MRKLRSASVRLVLAGILYVVIFRTVSFTDIRSVVTPALGFAMALTVILTLVQAALCTARWLLLSEAATNVPNFRISFLVYMEGLFFNQAFPSIVSGDAVRVLRWRAAGVRTADAVSSVIVDRMFGVSGVSVLALVSVWLLWRWPVETYKLLAIAGLSSMVIACCAVALLAMRSERLAAAIGRIPRLRPVLDELTKFRPNARVAVACVAYSVSGQVLSGIGVYFLARSLGVALPPAILVTVTSVVVLLSMIPISLAGWGVREAGFLAILVPLGAKGDASVLLGFMFGLTALAAALPGGFSVALGLTATPKPLPGG